MIILHIPELEPLIFHQAFYATLKELILAINVFAVRQDYAVVKRWIKKSKKKIL